MPRLFLPAAFLLIVIVLAAGAHPAAAAKPDVITEDVEGTFHFDCGSVVLDEPYTATFRTTVVRDDAGDPVRAVSHEQFVGTIINPETGETFRDRSFNTVTFDYATGELTITGKFGNLTKPGAGTLLGGVGRVTFDASGHLVFAAGRTAVTEAFFSATDGEAAYGAMVCAALVG